MNFIGVQVTFEDKVGVLDYQCGGFYVAKGDERHGFIDFLCVESGGWLKDGSACAAGVEQVSQGMGRE